MKKDILEFLYITLELIFEVVILYVIFRFMMVDVKYGFLCFLIFIIYKKLDQILMRIKNDL